MNRTAILLALALVGTAAYAFNRVSVQPPVGYAELAKAEAYRAVSPEGLPFRIRTFPNKPEKGLAFWSETLHHQLQNEGYRLRGEGQPFQAGEVPGMLYEWIVPYGNESYLYLTALLVSKKAIVLAEAAGPYALFLEYRQSVLDSLQTIRLRGVF